MEQQFQTDIQKESVYCIDGGYDSAGQPKNVERISVEYLMFPRAYPS